MIYKILLFISIAIGIAGQLFLKKGMNKHGKAVVRVKTIISDILGIYLHRWIIAGALLYALSLPLWTAALSKLDLSYAYPLVSVNFVAVSLFSSIFFKEKISRYRWLSIFVILAGVILVTMS